MSFTDFQPSALALELDLILVLILVLILAFVINLKKSLTPTP
jgi:hypothetical protein